MLFLSSMLIITGCSVLVLDSESVANNLETDNILLIIENSIYPSVQSRINEYINDISKENINSKLELWTSGDHLDLKQLIASYKNDVDTVFLIGDLPAAWYEIMDEGQIETFPCDLFYMDFNSVWNDNNNNGFYDSHSYLQIDIYTSRIIGTQDEINNYFSKVHNYRQSILQGSGSSLVFKDDDWNDFFSGSDFGISKIFNNVEIIEDFPITVKDIYINKLKNQSFDYVYQWIHSNPYALYIENNNRYEPISTFDINSLNIRGLFYNLFDCKAAKFTGTNIGMTYLTKTDYGLAVLGSTKIGGNYFPVEFHRILSLGGSWGSAYKAWYNSFGTTSDKWFLGMVILGDPTLKLNRNATQMLNTSGNIQTVIPPDTNKLNSIYSEMISFSNENN